MWEGQGKSHGVGEIYVDGSGLLVAVVVLVPLQSAGCHSSERGGAIGEGWVGPVAGACNEGPFFDFAI